MPTILAYDARFEDELIALLGRDPGWADFTKADTLEVFKTALSTSRTYLCADQGRVCGYLRAVVDGFGLYVSELYVAPHARRAGHGKALLARIEQDHPDRPVYVLSDEDWYYEVLGLKRIGSVFEL